WLKYFQEQALVADQAGERDDERGHAGDGHKEPVHDADDDPGGEAAKDGSGSGQARPRGKHAHDAATERADDGQREVNLADQQHQYGTQAECANGDDLADELGKVARREEDVPGADDLKEARDQQQGDDDRKYAKISMNYLACRGQNGALIGGYRWLRGCGGGPCDRSGTLFMKVSEVTAH